MLFKNKIESLEENLILDKMDVCQNGSRVVKRITKVEQRKIRQAEKIRVLLNLMGKTEKWLIDELKRTFNIKISVSKEIINGVLLLGLTNYVIQVSVVLGVRYQVFFEN